MAGKKRSASKPKGTDHKRPKIVVDEEDVEPEVESEEESEDEEEDQVEELSNKEKEKLEKCVPRAVQLVGDSNRTVLPLAFEQTSL